MIFKIKYKRKGKRKNGFWNLFTLLRAGSCEYKKGPI